MKKNQEETLKLRIERTEKVTRRTVQRLYVRIYKEAERLGFNVIPHNDNTEILKNSGGDDE